MLELLGRVRGDALHHVRATGGGGGGGCSTYAMLGGVGVRCSTPELPCVHVYLQACVSSKNFFLPRHPPPLPPYAKHCVGFDSIPLTSAVDVGEEGRIRTVCSGLVGHVPLEEMQVRW